MKTKKDLQQALKDEGLTYGYKKILEWEREGVIPRPTNVIQNISGETRLYSDEEIENIVDIVRQLKNESIQV